MIRFGGSVGVVYAMGDQRSAAAASFPGTPSAIFETRGPQSDRIAGLVDGYLNIGERDGRFSLRLGVNARAGDNETETGVFALGRMRF